MRHSGWIVKIPASEFTFELLYPWANSEGECCHYYSSTSSSHTSNSFLLMIFLAEVLILQVWHVKLLHLQDKLHISVLVFLINIQVVSFVSIRQSSGLQWAFQPRGGAVLAPHSSSCFPIAPLTLVSNSDFYIPRTRVTAVPSETLPVTLRPRVCQPHFFHIKSPWRFLPL